MKIDLLKQNLFYAYLIIFWFCRCCLCYFETLIEVTSWPFRKVLCINFYSDELWDVHYPAFVKYVAIENSRACGVFSFIEPGCKNGKMFASDGSYVIFLSYLYVCKAIQNFNAGWFNCFISFIFVVSLSCMDR